MNCRVADADLERPLAEVDRGDLLGEELGAEALGLLAELDHQLRAHDPVGEAGEVLDVGGEHQLPAGLIGGARRLALDDERLQVGARRVDGGGEAGRAGADDDDVVVAHACSSLDTACASSTQATEHEAVHRGPCTRSTPMNRGRRADADEALKELGDEDHQQSDGDRRGNGDDDAEHDGANCGNRSIGDGRCVLCRRSDR